MWLAHVRSFGRFDEILYLVEKAPDLTHARHAESGARARLGFRILSAIALRSVAPSLAQKCKDRSTGALPFKSTRFEVQITIEVFR
jgi:hypothetical protein